LSSDVVISSTVFHANEVDFLVGVYGKNEARRITFINCVFDDEINTTNSVSLTTSGCTEGWATPEGCEREDPTVTTVGCPLFNATATHEATVAATDEATAPATHEGTVTETHEGTVTGTHEATSSEGTTAVEETSGAAPGGDEGKGGGLSDGVVAAIALAVVVVVAAFVIAGVLITRRRAGRRDSESGYQPTA
jgi:hypothetical protein